VLYAGTARQTVVLAGGVRTPSDALVGPVTISALRQLHLDVVFLGVHGMDPHRGFTTPNLLEADVDRAFVDAAQRLVVIADHTKWGVVGLPQPAVEVLAARVASVLRVGIGDGPNGLDGFVDGPDKERYP
jgi:DeoR/GlpR family transcriptional regulator of sugar metabolism